MPLSLFDWRVPQAGYGWNRLLNWSPGGGLILMRNEGEWETQTFPLRDAPALFRAFAELEPTPDAVLEFANEHGCLGIWDQLEPEVRKRTPNGWEALAQWADAIFAIRQVIDLWTAAETRDEETLRKWLTVVRPSYAKYHRRNMVRGFQLQGFERITDRPGLGPTSPLADYIRDEKDIFRAARFVAQLMVNRGLDANTRAALVYDPESKSHDVHVVPRNLLGALWVQTAGLAVGDREYRRCEQCRDWYAVSPDTSRSDKTFCSDRCRHKAYRDRKKQARELHRCGKTPSAIARELKSERNTVRRWLGVA